MAARRLVMALDLARSVDYPALAVVELVLEKSGEIEHSRAWHETSRYCERPYCAEEERTTYYVRHLDRLRRPGKEVGVAPLVETTLAWVEDLHRRAPTVPVDVLVDVSGGDYKPMFAKALAGTKAHLTAVEMTATGPEPSHNLGASWMRVSRTRLLSNLQVRLEQKQVRMPRGSYEAVRGELLAMRKVVTESRNLVFEAGQHDDVVVALAIATWPDLAAGRVAHAPGSVIWD